MWLCFTGTAEERFRSEQEPSDRASHEQLIYFENFIVLILVTKWRGKKIRAGEHCSLIENEHCSLIENQSSASYCQKQLLGCFFFCREAAAGTLPVQQLKIISKNPSANWKVLGLKNNKVFGDWLDCFNLRNTSSKQHLRIILLNSPIPEARQNQASFNE